MSHWSQQFVLAVKGKKEIKRAEGKTKPFSSWGKIVPILRADKGESKAAGEEEMIEGARLRDIGNGNSGEEVSPRRIRSSPMMGVKNLKVVYMETEIF